MTAWRTGSAGSAGSTAHSNSPYYIEQVSINKLLFSEKLCARL